MKKNIIKTIVLVCALLLSTMTVKALEPEDLYVSKTLYDVKDQMDYLETVSLKEGEKLQLYGALATTDMCKEENCTDKIITVTKTDLSLTWKSNDEKVVKVSKGKLTAVKEGTTTVKATYKNGDKNYTRTITVNVVKEASDEEPLVVDVPDTASTKSVIMTIIGLAFLGSAIKVVLSKRNN